MKKDPVIVELMISAQFDTGHYQYIGLTDPNGTIISERRSSATATEAPLWFTRLFPIETKAGIAQVQDGWSQYGTLKLESHSRFAYAELWRSTLLMLLWSLAIGIGSGYIGTLILRAILRPLNDVVNQAEAIGDRRFITIEEPKTTEFNVVVTAMNRLSNRIKKLLNEESQRLEELRLEANYDRVSSLMNRDYFLSRVDATISNDETFTEGVLVISRLSNLGEIDQKLGHTETDALLNRLGDVLSGLSSSNPALLAGRLNGTDFAVFCNHATDIYGFSSQIKGALYKAAGLHQSSLDLNLATIAGKFSNTQKDKPDLLESQTQIEPLVKLFTNVMADISANKTDVLHVIGESDIAKHQDNDEEKWRKLLTSALDAKRLKLAFYPVVNAEGKLIHQESPVRLQLGPDDEWSSAGEFISWAIRLDLMTRIDNLVLETALKELAKGTGAIGLNISSRAIRNPEFILRMRQMIQENPEAATRLWLEVPEQGAFEYLEEFREFCSLLKPLGCKIGIEHVGADVARLGELHELGLDYIKIDISVIRGIDSHPGNKAFLRGLCLIAHTMGWMTFAEGVSTDAEIACLPELGIDGMTGPGIKV
jgi:EAL domain-containing protein (putative c-di-GMP-specific phosphodiesterase class I)/GGDEF domain-containing protein